MALDAQTLRLAAVSASGIVYWVGVGVQALRVRRRIGRSPNLKPRGLKERILWLAWLAVIAVWIGQPLVMSRLGQVRLFVPVEALSGAWGAIPAAALIVCGQAGTYWCYAALGDSWRLGIKRRERTSLVTTGPYTRIRHPIYSFQIVMLLGAGWGLPTPLSLGILGLHVVCCYVKALDEEAYLAGVHGRAYADYQGRTGLFVPKLTRPRAGQG